MELTLSGPVKVFAIVAVLAAVVLGGGMMFLGRAPAEEDAAPIVLPKKSDGGMLQAIGKAKQVAAKSNAAVAKPDAVAGTAKPKAVAPAKPKPVAKAKAKPKPKPKPALIASNGLPNRIVAALRSRPVVVVALWSQGGKIDTLARDEAERGASNARAGFISLDVLGDAREAEALTLKLGVVLHAPAILIFTRPETVSLTLSGFQDHETVAQAAANVLR
jgi:hypothetical protein